MPEGGLERSGEKMSEQPYVVKTHDMKLDAEYNAWILELKQRYQATQIKAAVKVNSEQLLFNWQLGRDLVVRRAEEKWGKGVVEQVSLDLQAAFPGVKGFGVTNLWYMKRWYLFYTAKADPQKLQQLVEELASFIFLAFNFSTRCSVYSMIRSSKPAIWFFRAGLRAFLLYRYTPYPFLFCRIIELYLF